jgi:hypothetical protein
MSDAEFVMTYPCYFPLTDEGNPVLVQIDDALCICLFTDRRLLEAFHREKHRGKDKRTVKMIAMKSATELLAFLRNSESEFAKEGCGFVAIDVSPGKPLMYCAYAELMAEIAKHP